MNEIDLWYTDSNLQANSGTNARGAECCPSPYPQNGTKSFFLHFSTFSLRVGPKSNLFHIEG